MEHHLKIKKLTRGYFDYDHIKNKRRDPVINRAIVIFPKFKNSDHIQKIRKDFDPLYAYIEPHITLVFPFESDLTKNDLKEHLEKQLEEIKPFEVMLKGVTGANDGYIFLDMKEGNDQIIKLHDNLYTGILEDKLNRFIPYVPHITLGQLSNKQSQIEVVEELYDFTEAFRTTIDKVSVELIDDSEKSVLELEYWL